MIRVLLVEDEASWQEAFGLLLETDGRVKLVATTDNAREAMQLVESLRPDIVLLDWQIVGDEDGVALGHRLIETHGMVNTQFVLVSGANPADIPPNDFCAIPKSRMALQLCDTIVQQYEKTQQLSNIC